MKLEINLASRPFRNNLLFNVLAVLLGLGVVLASFLNGRGFAYHTALRKELTAQVDRAEAGLKVYEDEIRRMDGELNQVNMGVLSRDAQFANQAISRRTFSWTRLFNQFERELPNNVMMQTIRPVIDGNAIRIDLFVQGKSLDDILDFIANLQESPHFFDVFSEEQADRTGRSGSRPGIEYHLTMGYDPEGDMDPEARVRAAEAELPAISIDELLNINEGAKKELWTPTVTPETVPDPEGEPPAPSAPPNMMTPSDPDKGQKAISPGKALSPGKATPPGKAPKKSGRGKIKVVS